MSVLSLAGDLALGTLLVLNIYLLNKCIKKCDDKNKDYDERVIIEKDYVCVSASSTKMLWKGRSEEATLDKDDKWGTVHGKTRRKAQRQRETL